MTTTILLIDLSGIVHPLFHTTQGSTNPNECSIQTVAKVRALASGQPFVAICCDSGRSFRRELEPTYKAQRPESDATLMHQMTLAIETLKGDGFPVWSVKGFEADDLIASAVHRFSTNEYREFVTIASSDKDLMQLIEHNKVKVHRLLFNGSQKAVDVDNDQFYLEYGIHPNQFTEWLMLVGDKSDNIKGADGIGEKKATAMLAKYGNLADLYAAMDKGEKFQPATVKSLTEFRPRMDAVRALVTLRSDVPLPFEEVFKERVPADVAVFDGGEPMEVVDAVSERPADVSDGTNHGSDPRTPDSGRAEPAAPLQSNLLSDSRDSQPKPADTRRVEQASAPQSLAVREAEVLPPPSGEFSMQLEPRSLREAALLASEIHKSRLFSAYGTYQGVLSTILAGRELGMQAMASLRAFHILDGKPTMSADLIRALVLKSGHAKYFRCTERAADHATFITKRKGDPEVSLTYTVAEAQAAGLVKPGSGWQKSPADMCVARASSKLARLVYADIVFNMYAPEEMEQQ